MNKNEFIDLLKLKLSRLPQNEVDDRISFYSEMIDDEIADGRTEEEVIENLGPIDDIVSQIIADVPLAKLIKEKVTPKRNLKALEIVLLIIGFPIWFPLIITFASLFFVGYILIWVMVLLVYVLDIAFIGGAFGGIGVVVGYISVHNGVGAMFMTGCSISLLGLGILMILFSKEITLGIFKMTKSILLGIKRMIVGKE